GLTEVNAYDGRDGWQVQPFGGRREAERLSADDTRELAQQGDLEPLLLAARDQGCAIESQGLEDLDGSPAHKLRIRRQDGDVQYVFLDPDSMLEVRVTTVHKVRGVEQVNEVDVGNYAQAGGLWLPLSIESGEQGKPRTSRVTVEQVEIDVEAGDAL